jgi:hypothetical protein
MAAAFRRSDPAATRSPTRHAADYILKLPKAEQKDPAWQTATEPLIMAAESRGPLLHARVGVMGALNRNVERVFNSDRKDHHWGEAEAGAGSIVVASTRGTILFD